MRLFGLDFSGDGKFGFRRKGVGLDRNGLYLFAGLAVRVESHLQHRSITGRDRVLGKFGNRTATGGTRIVNDQSCFACVGKPEFVLHDFSFLDGSKVVDVGFKGESCQFGGIWSACIIHRDSNHRGRTVGIRFSFHLERRFSRIFPTRKQYACKKQKKMSEPNHAAKVKEREESPGLNTHPFIFAAMNLPSCMLRILPLIMGMGMSTTLLAQDSVRFSGSLPFHDLPQFTYGQGLGITSPDSLYQLNIRFRMQNRFSVDVDQNRISEVEARVRRARLRLDGFVFSTRIRYAMQLSFAHEDIGDFIGNIPNILRDGMIYYTVHPDWVLSFGQTKLPGNRERVVSSGDLQLADRSSVNAIFNIDRDFGFQVYHQGEGSGPLAYVLKGAISTGEGRNWISSKGNFLSYTLRFELLPFGAFANKGDFFQGDLQRETSPKLSLAAAYNYNHKALRSAGQRGGLLDRPRDIRNLFADVLFKYRGWSLACEYAWRHAEDPVDVPLDPEDNPAFVFNGQGLAVQASYLFPSNYELIGRYSGVFADEEIVEWVPLRSNGYTLGCSKYLRGHRLKAQFDVSWFDEWVRSGGDHFEDYWQIRFQVELGI